MKVESIDNGDWENIYKVLEAGGMEYHPHCQDMNYQFDASHDGGNKGWEYFRYEVCVVHAIAVPGKKRVLNDLHKTLDEVDDAPPAKKAKTMGDDDSPKPTV